MSRSGVLDELLCFGWVDDRVSAVPTSFPYSFFTPGMQAMLTGTRAVGDKPRGYQQQTLIDAPAAGV